MERQFQPANPHPEHITPPQWDLLYTAESRLQYSGAPTAAEAKAAEDRGAELQGQEEEDEEGGGGLGGAANVHLFSSPAPWQGLCDSLKSGLLGADGAKSEWAAWAESADLMTAPLPAPFQDTVNAFQRLVVIKVRANPTLFVL